MKDKLKCVLVLSDKSSGSSTLQRELVKHPQVHIIRKTIHAQNETVYWNKAVALLGLPHEKLLASSLNYTQQQGRELLIQLLRDNLSDFEIPSSDKELIFNGWKKLCETFGPVFLEKSPHHLLSAEALKLICECMDVMPEIDFKFIGLVRNPMDTIYSYWKRWSVDPSETQHEWLGAYKNLEQVKEKVKDKLLVVRYEDVVQDQSCTRKICDFIGIEYVDSMGKGFHSNAVSKWKKDKMYGFKLDPKIFQFAESFGYTANELMNDNKSNIIWTLNKVISRKSYSSMILQKRTKKFLRKIKHRILSEKH